jgi:hypothetical protein
MLPRACACTLYEIQNQCVLLTIGPIGGSKEYLFQPLLQCLPLSANNYMLIISSCLYSIFQVLTADFHRNNNLKVFIETAARKLLKLTFEYSTSISLVISV